jgi:hypothetical protein
VFSVLPEDLEALERFPLAWRWTDQRWNLLPPEKLAGIRPLVKAKATEAYQHRQRFVNRSRLRPDLFPSRSEFDDSQTNDPTSARAWLKCKPVDGDPVVFICWEHHTAVVTVWSIFCDFWNDFCYPLDCVVVWPESEAWVLVYSPDERLYFGGIGTQAGPENTRRNT